MKNIIQLTVEEVKEAIVDYISAAMSLDIQPEHIEFTHKLIGQYSDMDFEFSGVEIVNTITV